MRTLVKKGIFEMRRSFRYASLKPYWFEFLLRLMITGGIISGNR
jgi:hypothetical protein